MGTGSGTIRPATATAGCSPVPVPILSRSLRRQHRRAGNAAGPRPPRLEPLEPRRLLSAVQIVSAVPPVQSVPAGASFDVSARYDTSDGDATLGGLGLRLHFDAGRVTLDELTDVLGNGLLARGQVPQADTDDLDADPATDSVVLIIWFDFTTNWPGNVPTNLFTARFTAAPDLDAATHVNFSAIEAAPGYTFAMEPARIDPAVPNQPPRAVGSIADVVLGEDSPPRPDHADLDAIFDDPDHGDSQLDYAIVGHTAPDVVRVTIDDDGRLGLQPLADRHGDARITVEATDPDLAKARTSFEVSIFAVNDPPRVVAAAPQVHLASGTNEMLVDLSGHFHDVDVGTTADRLELGRAGHTNAGLIGAEVVGQSLRLHDPAPIGGEADITVRATDTAGRFADQIIHVVVEAASTPDAPPVVAVPIEDVLVGEDRQSGVIDLGATFQDGDQLTFTVAANTHPDLVEAIVDGDALTLRYDPARSGTAAITVTATDAAGNTASQTFTVTVPPRPVAPAAVGAIPDVVVTEDLPPRLDHVDLADVFDDPDGDDAALVHLVAANTDPLLVQPVIAPDGTLGLHFGADRHGDAAITIRATDPDGGAAEQTFHVTVLPVNDAPRADAVLPDVSVTAGDGPTTLALEAAFTDVDIDTEGDALTFAAVANTNADLVQAAIDGDQLVLSWDTGGHGIAHVTVRATDRSGAYAEQAITVDVAAPPLPDLVVTSLVVPPAALVPGTTAPFTLTVANVGTGALVDGYDLTLTLEPGQGPPTHASFVGPDLRLLPGAEPPAGGAGPLGDHFGRSVALAAGASDTFTVELSLPASTALYGRFAVHGELDAGGAVAEADDLNNTFGSFVYADQLVPLGTDRSNRRIDHVTATGERLRLSVSKGSGYVVLRRYASADASVRTADLRRVVLAVSGPATSLGIRNRGPATMGGLSADGLRRLSAPRLQVTGDVRIEGSADALQVGDVGDGVWLRTGAPARRGTTLRAGRVGDVLFEVAGLLRSMRAVDVRGGRVAADGIGTLLITGDRRGGVAGDFGADLALSGAGATRNTLGTARIAGDLHDAQWEIAGPGIGRLDVKATFDHATVGTTGPIKSARFGHMTDARLLAGLDHQPADIRDVTAASFIAPVAIERLTIKGLMSNAHVAAPHLGRVMLGTVLVHNAGADFGLAAGSYGTVRRPDGARLVFPLGRPAELDRESDYVVRIV